MNQDVDMVVTDLDGTLLDDDQQAHQEDLNTLRKLGDQNILRVVATGRNLYSALNKLDGDFPIDYLIFSSGAGILEWKSQRLIHSEYLPGDQVEAIAGKLIDYDIDFMIHEVIPENHKFVYHRSQQHNPDFERRYRLYKKFAVPLDPASENYQHACQILAIPGERTELHEQLIREIPEAKVIRTTSPLDGISMWIEIFPAGVSKGHGVEWLCQYTHTDPAKTLGIGNDYNDLDLLKFTHNSLVVENAPDDLKNLYPSCNSNQNCGFTDAVKKILGDL
ncbi:MAG: HAD family phosphatase [Bacteroidales bacterium]|nr:HAD family phosphatase [Bacteroidales bacterium]